MTQRDFKIHQNTRFNTAAYLLYLGCIFFMTEAASTPVSSTVNMLGNDAYTGGTAFTSTIDGLPAIPVNNQDKISLLTTDSFDNVDSQGVSWTSTAGTSTFK
jgi:hypothetical protein